MNRVVMAFFSLVLITNPAYVQVSSQHPAQSRCGLTEANAPKVRGIRLGMSTEQLLALFPGSAKRTEMKDDLERAKAASDSDTVHLSFDPAADAISAQFAGIDSVGVGLHKGRVVEFSVTYVGPTWKTIDEWVAKLSDAFNLPRTKSWTVGMNESPSKVLRCNGIEIEAAIQGGGASIKISNTEHPKRMEQPASAAEKRKQREFKP